MRVFVAGATGVLGRQLVPVLVGAGHHVIAAGRNPDHLSTLPAGPQVEPVRLDLLDSGATADAVRDARADALVHLATAIPAGFDPKRIGAVFETTNRLRVEGTANLVAAGRAAGATRLVTQSIAFAYQPGATRRDETEALWVDPPPAFRSVLDAVRSAEQQTLDADGVVLRLGHLYGPGTAFGASGAVTDRVRAGKMPVVGAGGAVFSFVHTHDVATAVLAALDAPGRSVYNVVDDEPAPVAEWLPWFAQLLGGPAPRRVPKVIARLAAGAWAVAFMTALSGASNARARSDLSWKPSASSWREGLARELPRT